MDEGAAVFWIRADASAQMGLGHIMRTVALAEAAAERGHDVTFVVTDDPLAVGLPRRHGFAARAVQAGAVGWLDDVHDGDVVVFDGYHFPPDLMAGAREHGARVGAVDDPGEARYPVDVVVNQNPTGVGDYPEADRVLHGPRYALVRAEFRDHRRARSPRSGGTLLGTFGGADPGGMGGRFLDASRGSPFSRVRLVLGPAADPVVPDPAAVPPAEVVTDPRNLAALFDRSEAVVSGAGSTTWELLCMGLPVALVEVVDNQRGIATAVEDVGAALAVRWSATGEPMLGTAIAALADPERRRALEVAALDLVDGHGADRVVQALAGD